MNERDQQRIEMLNRLRAVLMKTENWPIKYMFKFIARNNPYTMKELMSIIPTTGQTSLKGSKDMNYMSVTHVNYMFSAEEIISLTEKATSIEGVISL